MNGKPKIAVLIDWYLPGTRAGGPVRSVFSLVQLLKDRFDFYVITTNADLGVPEPYADVPANRLFERDGVSYFYFSRDALSGRALLKLLAQISPALIYLNSFWSVSFSIAVLIQKWRGRISVPVLLAPRGMLGKGALGLKHFKKRAFLFVTRVAGFHRKAVFHATNRQEMEDILSEFPGARVHLAPNVNALEPLSVTKEKGKNALKMYFLSRISKVKNLHYALEVLREVDPRVEITYDIYGNIEDAGYWSFCEALIKKLPPHVKAAHRGEIPFDRISEAITKYHVLFLPTLNENYGHAIVESLLCGCPAIISDQTPWNDISTAGAGRALRLENKKDFKEAIEWYAGMDEEQFNSESGKAIRYIRNKVNLQETADLYTRIFHECIKN